MRFEKPWFEIINLGHYIENSFYLIEEKYNKHVI